MKKIDKSKAVLSELILLVDKLNAQEIKDLEEFSLKVKARVEEKTIIKDNKNSNIDKLEEEQLKEELACENLGFLMDDIENNLTNNVKVLDTIYAYVDGSFDKDRELYGSGVVFLDDSNNVVDEFSKQGEDIHRKWNVAGECEASITAIEEAIKRDAKEIVIFHDYEGVAKWAIEKSKGGWNTNNDYTKGYKARVCELRKLIKIKFEKVKGHSGDKWNDRADTLAKKAIGK